MMTWLAGFRGDLAWLHAQEGHRGYPYWPGGNSGVTIDPGLDLGHADWTLAEEALRNHLPTIHLLRLRDACGIRGPAAKVIIKSPLMREIRITRTVASRLLPQIADPYWRQIAERFPLDDAPSAVHTAMLSLAYNRGARNKELEVLRNPIEAEDWQEVGLLIREMQRDHELRGIRQRRRREGDLILNAL